MLFAFHPRGEFDLAFSECRREDDDAFAVIRPLGYTCRSGFGGIVSVDYLMPVIELDATDNTFSVGLFHLGHNLVRIQAAGPLDGFSQDVYTAS